MIIERFYWRYSDRKKAHLESSLCVELLRRFEKQSVYEDALLLLFDNRNGEL